MRSIIENNRTTDPNIAYCHRLKLDPYFLLFYTLRKVLRTIDTYNKQTATKRDSGIMRRKPKGKAKQTNEGNDKEGEADT
eukprot:8239241-Heterocapsa_arctica.AAC.1